MRWPDERDGGGGDDDGTRASACAKRPPPAHSYSPPLLCFPAPPPQTPAPATPAAAVARRRRTRPRKTATGRCQPRIRKALPPPVMHSQPLVASAAHRWPPIPAVVTVAWRGGGDRADDGGGSAALRHPCWPPHPASGDWVANATLVFFSRFGWVARRPPRAIAVSGGGCAPPVLVIWGQGGILVHAGRRHAVSPVQGRCEPRIQVAYAS